MVQVASSGVSPFTPDVTLTPAEGPKYKGWGATLDASMKLNNDIINALEYTFRESFPPDPKFDIAKAAQASPLFLDNVDALAKARSQGEFTAIESRITSERKNQETLASAGFWGGLTAGAVSGSISPTMLIPLAGELRGAKGVAQAFALAGAAGTANEAPLWFNQETRTGTDFAKGIAGQTILGGLMGSAAVGLRGRDAARIAKEFEGATFGHDLPPLRPEALKPGEPIKVYDAKGEVVPGSFAGTNKQGSVLIELPTGETKVVGKKGDELVAPTVGVEPKYDLIPAGGGDAGAKVRAEIGDVRLRNMDVVLSKLAKLAGPFGQILESTVPDLRQTIVNAEGKSVANPNLGGAMPTSNFGRRLAIMLGNPGMALDHSGGTGGLVAGGSVEARVKIHFRALVPLIKNLDTAYAMHVLGPEPALAKATQAKLRSRLGKLPEGKLTREQFGAEVTRVVHEGPVGALPEVVKAAESTKEFFKYYEDMMKRYHAYRKGIDGGKASTPFKLWEGGQYKEGYFSRLYDRAAVRSEAFITLLQNHFEKNLQAMFVRQLEQYAGKVKAFEKQLAAKGIKGTKAYEKHLGLLQKERAQLGRKLKAFADAPDPKAEQPLRDRLAEVTDEIKWTEAAASPKTNDVASALRLREEVYTSLEEWTGNTIARKGGTDINITNGVADFKEISQDIARHVAHKIRGDELRAHNIDIMTGKAGPMLGRLLDIPYKDLSPYLVKDPEAVARAYNRHMGADLEMYRMFGNVNMAPQLAKLQREFDNMNLRTSQAGVRRVTPGESAKALRQGEKPPKVAKAVNSTNDTEVLAGQTEAAKMMENLQVLRDRLRKQRNIPENPEGFLYRAGRVVRDSNVAAHMGMVALSSISDIGRPVMKYGLTKAFKDGWIPLITNSAKIKWARDQAQFIAVALDPFLHGRSNAIFDTVEGRAISQTGIERVAELAANRTGGIALFDRWTAMMKHVSFAITATEISRGLRLASESGKLPAMYRDMFFDAGLSNDLQRRIWKAMNTEGGGTKFGKDILPNTERWTDLDAADAYASAIQKLVEMDNITTPGIGLPKWMDKNAGFQMLAQFRSFTADSTAKVLVAGAQDFKVGGERRMAVTEGAVFMLALGAVSYYTSAAAAGGRTWERAKTASIGDVADEAIDRSGLLGWLNEGLRLGEQFPATHDYVRFGARWSTRRSPEGPMGVFLGPSYDTGKRLLKVGMGLDSPTKSTVHTLRTLTPYQNVWYLRRGFTAIENLAASPFPKRRVSVPKKGVTK